MWGVALFGSVEPQPGSIEGIIYTTISFTEHLYVLIAVALQMLLFVWLLFKWETLSRKRTDTVLYSSTGDMKNSEGPGSKKTQEGKKGFENTDISGNLEYPGSTETTIKSGSPEKSAYAPVKLRG